MGVFDGFDRFTVSIAPNPIEPIDNGDGTFTVQYRFTVTPHESTPMEIITIEPHQIINIPDGWDIAQLKHDDGEPIGAPS